MCCKITQSLDDTVASINAAEFEIRIEVIVIKNKKIIVVLGMHRSGTSAITRGLHVLGVQFGDKMMPPVDDDNPKGYWEDIDLNTLNVEILHAIGSDWRRVGVIDSSDVKFLHEQGYFLRALELIRAKTGEVALFAFKDPRVAILMPFWKEVFTHCQLDVSYILAVRHPLSVVKSLIKRGDFDSEHCFLLWLTYVMGSLVGSIGTKRVCVDYDRLIRAPEHELSRIAKHLDLKVNSIELERYKTEFLDEGLRHTFYNLKDLLLDGGCPPLVKDIYPALIDVASDNSGFDDVEGKVTQWSDKLERLKLPLKLIDKLFEQKVIVNQIVTDRDEQVVNLTQTVTDRDEQVINLNQALNERDHTISQILDSNSWRLTSPFRKLKLFLLNK